MSSFDEETGFTEWRAGTPGRRGSKPSSGDALVRNSLINLTGLGVSIVISLVTVPLYLDEVGASRYGVLALVWLLLGYFGVFNLGLGRAAGNRIARVGPHAVRERELTFWTAFGLAAAVGLAGAACMLALGYTLLGEVLQLSATLRDEALPALPWLALAVPFVTVSGVCVGALEGLERFGWATFVETLGIAVFQIAPLLISYATGPDLETLIAAAAAAPVASAVVGFGSCWRALPLAHVPRASASTGRSLLRFGGWATVTAVVNPLLTILDRFVIGALLSARAVAVYTIPYNLVTRLVIVPLSVARTLFPRFSYLTPPEARLLAHRVTVAVTALMTPVVVLGTVVVEPFLELWVGAGFAHAAVPVAEIVLLGVWIHGLMFVPSTFLQAQGRPDLPAKFQLLELPPYLAALFLGLAVFGVEGAAWAWTARVALDGLLLFAASGLLREVVEAAVPAGVVVGLTTAAALTVFDDLSVHAVVGAALVLVALAWSWRLTSRTFEIALLQPVRTATARFRR